ncbi:unnamed protein product [Caenorhabditis auriculariae]|uniref:Uncharacterized protein n=1 Tax=Caenorhabditis auriculariae TaxID=2777116 RepID=A0A8S1HN13_9PELO|nr:unnamed protein product [Caenorhabditis auriculariae]
MDFSVLNNVEPAGTSRGGNENDDDGVDVLTAVENALGEHTNEQDDYINRFAEDGNLDYNDFMRITGGQTIEEELANNSAALEEEEEEEEVDIEDEEDFEGHVEDGEMPGTSNSSPEKKPEAPARASLPEFIRSIMDEMVSEGSSSRSVEKKPTPGSTHEKVANILKRTTQRSEETDQPTSVPNLSGTLKSELDAQEDAYESQRKRPVADKKSSKTLDALLGQANLLIARGDHENSLEMLMEVIRLDSRNSVAYRQVSTIYHMNGEVQRALQYGLLSAHLDSKTSAPEWIHWGDESKNLYMYEEAAACYSRALRSDQTSYEGYQKRIEMLDLLGLRPLAMRTRLQAAQMIDSSASGITFDWFQNLIKTLAQYYMTINDEERAIQALEAFVYRSMEFGRSADAQHDTLISMLILKGRFSAAATSILALCPGIQVFRCSDDQPAFTISHSNGSPLVVPFPPTVPIRFRIDDRFRTEMLARLIHCFIALGRLEIAKDLVNELLERDLSQSEIEPLALEIARVFISFDKQKLAKKFLDDLAQYDYYTEYSAEYWFIYGGIYMSAKEDELAMDAYERVLELNPSHVDSRITLSTLQQRAGFADRALDTLRGHDLDQCTQLPDERLLVRQADVLFERQEIDQFIHTTRLLLAPHFYEVHREMDQTGKKRNVRASGVGISLSNVLRSAAVNALVNTHWERLVRRLGQNAVKTGRNTDTLDISAIHDYSLKLIESLIDKKRFGDALVVCCYAFLQPRLYKKSDRMNTFHNLLYFCAIKAHSWTLAFEYIRWYHHYVTTTMSQLLPNDPNVLLRRVANAMNFVFVNSQNISYHRYIMRALAKAPESLALQTISGNNSLITGTYRHALGEYLRVHKNPDNQDDSLMCLMLSLTFTHMACKKDLSSRHLIALRGLAFMKRYAKNRKVKPEVFYNIGRMFHQMGLVHIAKHFYEKVLSADPPLVYYFDRDANEHSYHSKRYDLRPMAAHNLALIFKNSGNELAARDIYEKFLVV